MDLRACARAYFDINHKRVFTREIRRYRVDDVNWTTPSHGYLDPGDIYEVQDTGQFWMRWAARWVGPFTSEAAAVTALRMVL
jgi:hypothetical protein